ncbi:hypothetical protein SAMN05428944_0516 [Streptomyces sp. 1222.5]|nr:hypothetical protein BX260_7579 [Streptomyces sp. 5112.2]SEB59975.1 hypothetical protein SAMN05428944_0516 [Streptomyces sp. 1222.5]
MDASMDRIARPWGLRTPYSRREPWPPRVDTFLEAGVEPEAVQHWVQAASILHSDGDAMDIAVKDGRMVGVRGRMDDRVNRGRPGPKDLFGWQANPDWDPASEQPLFKTAAAALRLVEPGRGTPAPAPTTTASAPVHADAVPATAGGPSAVVAQTAQPARDNRTEDAP